MPGRGIRARVEGSDVLLGNPALLAAEGIDVSAARDALAQLGSSGSTPILAAIDGRLAGVIGIADEIKPESRGAIAEMRRMGLEVVMLTGDNERTAKAVAAE